MQLGDLKHFLKLKFALAPTHFDRLEIFVQHQDKVC